MACVSLQVCREEAERRDKESVSQSCMAGDTRELFLMAEGYSPHSFHQIMICLEVYRSSSCTKEGPTVLAWSINKIPLTWQIKGQTFISHHSRGWKVQDQCAGR